jgi:hypothetical protein
MPIQGEQYEIARRVEIRRRCHVETKGLRTKMYEKRRNGPRSSWKTHTSRYLKNQDQCYRFQCGKKGKKRKDAQQSKDDEKRRPGEDEEEKDAQQSDDDPECSPRKD